MDMDGFGWWFPAKIGDTVFVIAPDDRVYPNVVLGYQVEGERTHDVKIKLGYTNAKGEKKVRYRALSQFDISIFGSRKSADWIAAEIRRGEVSRCTN